MSKKSISKKLHRVTIDRSKWRCGGDNAMSHGTPWHMKQCRLYETTSGDKGEIQDTALHGKAGKCCLGFVCQSYGVRVKDMVGVCTPEGLNASHDQLPTLIDAHEMESAFTAAAMKINDDAVVSRADREKQLITLARAHGEIWKFVGKYNE